MVRWFRPEADEVGGGHSGAERSGTIESVWRDPIGVNASRMTEVICEILSVAGAPSRMTKWDQDDKMGFGVTK